MKLQDKVFQMFICGTGDSLDYALKNNLGGVIFFSRDIRTKDQFCGLVRAIKNQAKNYPFLSIDQEGGRVERTKNIHPGYLSPKEAFNRGAEFLKIQTKSITDELKSYGLNMNFAPCLDVDSNPNNPIIGDRAFSNSPDEVIKGYDIVAPIYKKAGIIHVIKHFPGHGDSDKDSHKELPQIDLSMSKMKSIHIKPFEHAISKGADMVMVAHLHCTCYDKTEIPTSLSKNCMNYLRTNLKFKGLAISDDMYMKGLDKYGMREACIMGIEAGLNMFIYKTCSAKTLYIMEDIIHKAEKDSSFKEKINESYERITLLKQKYNLIKLR